MARVTFVIDQISHVGDLSRFLELLELVGIDTDGSSHPVQLSADGSRSISASLGVDQLDLPSDGIEHEGGTA
jgi:hypothetical protein